MRSSELFDTEKAKKEREEEEEEEDEEEEEEEEEERERERERDASDCLHVSSVSDTPVAPCPWSTHSSGTDATRGRR